MTTPTTTTGPATTTGNPSVLQRSAWESLLCQSAQEVFAMMIGTSLSRCTSQERVLSPEFTALVGLAGPICGLFSIRCSSRAATLIAARMLHAPVEQVDGHTSDAMGEVCNMVTGHFKAKLGKIGERSLLSVPTVVKGSDYKLRPMTKGSVVECLLTFSEELLSFKLEYKLTALPS